MSATLASELHKYPHIERLTEDSPLYLLREVVCTEKIDGTNARFGLVGGEFQVAGRNIIFRDGNDPFGFASWVRGNDIEARVRAAHSDAEDVTYFGEWFGPRIQKGIDYGTERRFAGFDVHHRGTYLDVADATEAFGRIGFAVAPVVYRGPLMAWGTFNLDALRAQVTAIGTQRDGNLWEGVVIRPTGTLRDRYGNLLIAKLKNPAFEEKRAPREPRDNPAGLAPEDAAAIGAYCTEERLRHVLTALREAGEDVTTARATGAVIRAMVADVLREATGLTDAQRRAVGKVVPGEARMLYFAAIGA